MVLKMFMIFDSAVGAFDRPLFAHSKGEMLRDWNMVVNDEKLKFKQAPGDYTLFEVGEFDNISGQVTMYQAKSNLGTATEFIRKLEAVEA